MVTNQLGQFLSVRRHSFSVEKQCLLAYELGSTRNDFYDVKIENYH